MKGSYSEDSVLTDLVSKYSISYRSSIYICELSGDKEVSRFATKVRLDIYNSYRSEDDYYYRGIPSFYYDTLEEDVRVDYLSRTEIISKKEKLKIKPRGKKAFIDKMKETVKLVSERLRRQYPYSTSKTALKMFRRF
jgi:hypothetical protein